MAKLNARGSEVLHLLENGFSQRNIARELGVSERSVSRSVEWLTENGHWGRSQTGAAPPPLGGGAHAGTDLAQDLPPARPAPYAWLTESENMAVEEVRARFAAKTEQYKNREKPDASGLSDAQFENWQRDREYRRANGDPFPQDRYADIMLRRGFVQDGQGRYVEVSTVGVFESGEHSSVWPRGNCRKCGESIRLYPGTGRPVPSEGQISSKVMLLCANEFQCRRRQGIPRGTDIEILQRREDYEVMAHAAD